jgi:hypothetical protein
MSGYHKHHCEIHLSDIVIFYILPYYMDMDPFRHMNIFNEVYSHRQLDRIKTFETIKNKSDYKNFREYKSKFFMNIIPETMYSYRKTYECLLCYKCFINLEGWEDHKERKKHRKELDKMNEIHKIKYDKLLEKEEKRFNTFKNRHKKRDNKTKKELTKYFYKDLENLIMKSIKHKP